MKRRELFKKVGLATESILGGLSIAQGKQNSERVLRIAHITDVHIQPEDNVPERVAKCLEEIKTKNIDFILNGGDTIMGADTVGKTQGERVKELWDSWNEAIRPMRCSFEIHSCLGANDMWLAPEKDNPMYGKDYVMKQLKMPERYYSFNKKDWHFIIIDRTRDNLDGEQQTWLDNDLASVPANMPVIIMGHYPFFCPSSYATSTFGPNPSNFRDFIYKHRDKKIHYICGASHRKESAVYDGVKYFINGALSGASWGDGDRDSAAKGYVWQTPPGYAILDLYDDGTLVNEYIPHSH